MSSGRGMGRGALMRSLMDSSASSSSDDVPKQSSQEMPDSGLGRTCTESPPVDLHNDSRSSGRGIVRDFISSLSSEVSIVPRGLGRARIFDSLSQSAVRPALQTSSDENSDTAYLPARQPRGRGTLLANLRMGSGSENELTNQNIADKIASPPRPVLDEKMSQLLIKSPERETEQLAVIKRGTKGKIIDVVTNYIQLNFDPNTGVFEYEVIFRPHVDSMDIRHKYLHAQIMQLGVVAKTFDGQTLYLPSKLPEIITVLHAKNNVDQSDVEIRIIFKKQKRMSECMHLYNVLFDRIMRILNYVKFDRKKFDPTAPKLIPQHKLEIWPGYVTAVDEYEGGVMLCLDVSHRVLCQNTVLDHLITVFRKDKENGQENALKSLLGSVVLTRYNNKTYRIDDVVFDQSPASTFVQGGKDVSYIDYYKTQYNIVIKDTKQPLLLSRIERRVSGQEKKQEFVFCLIPEICYLTGMTEEMRSDFKVMRDIAAHTRVSPNQRALALTKFCENVNTHPEATAVLKQWGLTLGTTPTRLQARALDVEKIIFANRTESAGDNADFNRFATNNEVLEAINLDNWLVIHTSKDAKFARNFIDCMERNSRPMGISVTKPQTHVLQNDRTEAYVQALRTLLNAKIQIVVMICPTSRDDRYAAIKRICCSEIPVPSQVINAKTLSNEAKNRSIVQKIALQMNCKMGGTLWSVKIPLENVMICGIDTYHAAGNKSESVSGFVASLNGTYTKWFSRAVIQKCKEEFVNGLISSLKGALQAYKMANQKLPSKIIIYRDGVGDGQLRMCKEYEIPQLQDACKLEHKDYDPDFTYIVVQKRINTRIFLMKRNELENPLPGAVLDHTVTRKFMYDFFLVPQSVRQGSVTPTHYIVVHDSANFSPDILQRLSYKLCFMYYNWPGTVRVPACCQYAHKLAYLIGQSVKRHASEKLEDKLYYL